jgi:hypothetical protein
VCRVIYLASGANRSVFDQYMFWGVQRVNLGVVVLSTLLTDIDDPSAIHHRTGRPNSYFR